MSKQKRNHTGHNPANLLKSILGNKNPIVAITSLSKAKRNSLFSYANLWEADGVEILFGESTLQREVFAKYFRHLQKVEKWAEPVLFSALHSNLEKGIQWIRNCKLFLNARFVASFATFLELHPSKTGCAFLPQMEHLVKLHSNYKEKLQEANAELRKYSKLELLSLLAIWLDEAYVETSLKSLDGIQALNPVHYYAISKAINEHLRDAEDGNLFEDGQQTMENFMGVLEKAKVPAYWHRFQLAMMQVLNYCNWEELLSSFAHQGFQVVFPEIRGPEIIKGNRKLERNWDRVDQQYQALEHYFHDLGYHSLPNEFRGLAGIAPALNPSHQSRWVEMGLPNEMIIDGKRINFKQTVLFMTALSDFHKHRYVEKFDEIYQEENLWQSEFQPEVVEKAIRGRNLWVKPMMGPINFSTVEYLVDRVLGKTTFHQEMDREGIIAGVNFLTVNLEKTSRKEFDLYNHPFLKVNDLIVSFPRNLRYINPPLVVQNALWNWSSRKHKNEFSSRFEELIAEELKNAGFEVKTNVILKDDVGQDETEIDVLAWTKDEVLVVQAKRTLFRSSVKSSSDYRPTLEKAGDQVDISIECIEQRRLEIAKELSFASEDFEISGLVISSSLEGNYERFGSGHYPKISLTELQVLLRNGKQLLLDWDHETMAMDIGPRGVFQFMQGYSQMTGSFPYDMQSLLGAKIRQKTRLEERIKKHFISGFDQDRSIKKLMHLIQSDWLWKNVLTEKKFEFPEEQDSDTTKNAYLAFYTGTYLFERKQYEEAIPYFEKAFALTPECPEYLGFQIDCTAESGRLEEAIPKYLKQIELFPDYVAGYFNLALTYKELGDLENALEYYEKAYWLDPENNDGIWGTMMDLKVNTGFGQVTQEDMDRFSEIATRNPLFADSYQNTVLNKLSSESPSRPGEYEEIAMQFATLGKFQKALRLIDKALIQEPGRVTAVFYRGYIKRQLDMFETALEDFTFVIQQDPKNSPAWDHIGFILEQSGNQKGAFDAYQEALFHTPNFYQSHLSLGTLYLKFERYELAGHHLEQAVHHPFYKGLAWGYLGESYEGRSLFAEALVAYHQAVVYRQDQFALRLFALLSELKKSSSSK